MIRLAKMEILGISTRLGNEGCRLMNGRKAGSALEAPLVRPNEAAGPEIAPTQVAPAAPKKTPGRQWAPRMWQGMAFLAWVRLAARNGLHVSWTHAYMPVVITIVSLVHTILRQVERLVFGRRHMLAR